VLAIFLTLGGLLAIHRVWAKALFGLALLLQALALLFTQTRGAWIGTVIGAIVFITLLLALRGGPWRRALLGLGAALLVIALALRAAQPLLPPGTLLARAASALSPAEQTASIRLALWRLSVPGWLERPWLGHGPDTLATVFQRAYGTEIIEAEGSLGGASQYDRSENATLDTLLAVGAVGALSILVVGLLVCHAVWRQVARRGALPAAPIAGATAALAGHLTAQQFNVEVVGASFLAWTLAGALIGLARGETLPEEPPTDLPSRAFHLAAVPIALLCTAALGYFFELRALRAGLLYEAGLNLQRAARPAEAVPLLSAATSLWPHYFLFWAEQGYANRAAARLAPAGPEKERFYRQALDAVDRAVAINDAHPLIWSYWGDIAAEVAASSTDIGLRARARVAHMRATELGPNWWRYWQSAADADMLLGEFAAAKEKYLRAASLTPANWVLWASLGDSANRAGDYATARWAYERALGLRPGQQTEAQIERAIGSLPPFNPG
jgi:tetratricopeptide (TPR) repeat protein